MVNSILDEYDKLKKFVTQKEGIEIFKNIRKKLKKAHEYSGKLNTYLADTLDGVKPEDSARELKLP